MDFKERDVAAQRMEAGGKERKTEREREGGKRIEQKRLELGHRHCS